MTVGQSPRPYGSVSQLCASACLGGGLGQCSSGSLRCSGAGVPSYLAGRGSLGAFPWFVPLTLWWVHCNTHSFSWSACSFVRYLPLQTCSAQAADMAHRAYRQCMLSSLVILLGLRWSRTGLLVHLKLPYRRLCPNDGERGYGITLCLPPPCRLVRRIVRTTSAARCGADVPCSHGLGCVAAALLSRRSPLLPTRTRLERLAGPSRFGSRHHRPSRAPEGTSAAPQ